MHVLTILDHPDPDSFSAAVAHHFITEAEAAGHTTELADLHAEGFDPRWSMADIEGDGADTTPADVLTEQARIARADAICFVFPLFWWGIPAMIKGWVDRSGHGAVGRCTGELARSLGGRRASRGN